MSLAGRLALVNVVLSAIYTHLTGCLPLRSCSSQSKESMQSEGGFYGEEVNRIAEAINCLLSWDKVCWPKCPGRLDRYYKH